MTMRKALMEQRKVYQAQLSAHEALGLPLGALVPCLEVVQLLDYLLEFHAERSQKDRPSLEQAS